MGLREVGAAWDLGHEDTRTDPTVGVKGRGGARSVTRFEGKGDRVAGRAGAAAGREAT